VKSALTALPCVEPDSVRVDKQTKQARFQVKKGQTCDEQKIKDAVAKAGKFTVTNIEKPAKQ